MLFEYPANLESSLKKELLSTEKKDRTMTNMMDLEFVLTMDEV